MTDVLSPGLYTITPRHVEQKRLDLDGGKKEDGTKVQLYSDMNDSTYGPDQRFLFAHAGNNEYLIINAKSGTYITAAVKDGSQITGNLVSPLEKRARWRLVPVRNGRGSYYIYSVAYPDSVIDIYGGKTENGTAVITYFPNGGENQQFFLRQG